METSDKDKTIHKQFQTLLLHVKSWPSANNLVRGFARKIGQKHKLHQFLPLIHMQTNLKFQM